ncbi:MAG: uracil-DNA glycosylase, partial [Candidatus Thermoplasmatota archaeon]|nr:uracil-DNA glycosylase [Candidatus Thermoplasmatota archaeon]
MKPDIDGLGHDISLCRSCPLWESRHNAVPGEGRCGRGIVFIGEAPGRKEDETGRPFVGSAGKILDGLLAGVGFSREDVFITSILKCRPPGNRDPLPEEKNACSLWMNAQLEALKPRIIAPLGRHGLGFAASRYGLELGPISAEHGKPHRITEKWGEVVLFPLYHPAAL